VQTATKLLWAGAFAAAVGSLCCVAPLVLLTLSKLTQATTEAGFPSKLIAKP
jgi:hypothetical protein